MQQASAVPQQRQLATPALRALVDEQQGMLSRGQLIGQGFTPAQGYQNVVNGRWRAILPGVYATFTGSVSPLAMVWGAILYAGPGSVASHLTALWLAGLFDQPPQLLHLAVGHSRRVRPQGGLRIHRMNALDTDPEVVIHPVARPPRVRVEFAVLDQAAAGPAVAAIDVVLRATQRRITTADKLRSALALRPRHRWRRLLLEVLAEAGQGVASPLERHYLRDVERRHRLPSGIRNLPESVPGGGHRYRDVRYRAMRTVVELDGREAHPADGAFRDLRRDNTAVVAGATVLRYGWRDVVGSPCAVAEQVGVVLRGQGWAGRPVPCGPSCTLRTSA